MMFEPVFRIRTGSQSRPDDLKCRIKIDLKCSIRIRIETLAYPLQRKKDSRYSKKLQYGPFTYFCASTNLSEDRVGHQTLFH